MYLSTTIAVVAALAPFVTAHDGPAMPKIIGLNPKDLKARALLAEFTDRHVDVDFSATATLESRQTSQERCGTTFGSCAAGFCCSQGGYCGKTADHCYSPGCNYKFGPGCPENVTPAGASTSSVPRPKIGTVPYGGAGIYGCVKPGTVAITYDDGPLQGNTDYVLDVFKKYNAKATFFVTGNNIAKGAIDTTPAFRATIQRMHTEGHQIASHTWTHLDLSAITEQERRQQMWKLEAALRNIVGFFPTYMRPPYSSCSAASGSQQTMADLGYHVTYFDVDTDDYNQLTPAKIENSKRWFRGNITRNGATPQNSDWLAIAHEIHRETAYNLTEYMLSTLYQLGYKAVTTGECLGDPKANWYRTPGQVVTPTSTPTPSSTPSNPISTDGTCGGTKRSTCRGSTFGNCCSSSGWCGSTSAYCGAGCQSGFGTCTAVAPGTKQPSTDGSCGGTGQKTCTGTTFGNCCSEYGWCGSTTGHCGARCQSGFGTCS